MFANFAFVRRLFKYIFLNAYFSFYFYSLTTLFTSLHVHVYAKNLTIIYYNNNKKSSRNAADSLATMA